MRQQPMGHVRSMLANRTLRRMHRHPGKSQRNQQSLSMGTRKLQQMPKHRRNGQRGAECPLEMDHLGQYHGTIAAPKTLNHYCHRGLQKGDQALEGEI